MSISSSCSVQMRLKAELLARLQELDRAVDVFSRPSIVLARDRHRPHRCKLSIALHTEPTRLCIPCRPRVGKHSLEKRLMTERGTVRIVWVYLAAIVIT